MAHDKGKTHAEDTPVDPADLSDAEKVTLIRKQQADVDRLTKENEQLRAKVDEAEAARKAVLRKARAERLVASWEEAGRDFADEPTKTAEMDRLVKLSDEAFDATEAAVQAFAAGKKKKPVDPANPDEEEDLDEDGKSPFPPKKKPKKAGSLEADAVLSPSSSPDQTGSLQAKLTTGFLAAYHERVGTDA